MILTILILKGEVADEDEVDADSGSSDKGSNQHLNYF